MGGPECLEFREGRDSEAVECVDIDLHKID